MADPGQLVDATTAFVRDPAIPPGRDPGEVEVCTYGSFRPEQLHHVPPFVTVRLDVTLSIDGVDQVVGDFMRHRRRDIFVEVFRE